MLDVGVKPISEPRHGGERLAHIKPRQGFAQIIDRPGKGLVAARAVGPNAIDQMVAFPGASGALSQCDQNRHEFRFEPDGFIAVCKAKILGINEQIV